MLFAKRFVPMLLVPLLACVSDPSAVPSRYVGDLTGLERVKPGLWDELHLRAGVDLASYRAVFIAPVALAEHLDTQGEHYRAYDLELVRQRFDRALRNGFVGNPLLSETTGKHVLELRPTLTAVVANRPPLDQSNLGILSTARGVGGASMQLAIADSQTGELLAAIFDRQWGAEFSSNFNRNVTWGDAENAFRWWARTLVQWLARSGVQS